MKLEKFDLRNYLSTNNINEAYQSTIIGKAILNNPAKNFKYVVLGKKTGAIDYEPADLRYSYGWLKDAALNPMSEEKLNNAELFKNEILASYYYELINLLKAYVRYKHEAIITDEGFKNLYDRYILIYNRWKDSIQSEINKDDTGFFNALTVLLNEKSVEQLTDSNFKKYTVKEIKKLGSEFTTLKNGAILFYMNGADGEISEGNKIDKDSLIAVSFSDTFIYNINDVEYEKKKAAQNIINSAGFTSTYNLKMNDGQVLELPYISGLGNIIENNRSQFEESEKLENYYSKTEINDLEPFTRYAKKYSSEVNSRKKGVDFILRESIKNDTWFVDDNRVELENIISDLNIVEIKYTDFKYNLLNFYSSSHKLGNPFGSKGAREFGGLWGQNNEDYVYVLLPDIKYNLYQEDQAKEKGITSNFQKWVDTKGESYVPSSYLSTGYASDMKFGISNYEEKRNREDVNKLSKQDRRFLQDIDPTTGRRIGNHNSSKEDEEILKSNLKRYENKLDVLKNVNAKSVVLIAGYKFARDEYNKIDEKLEDVISFNPLNYVDKIKDKLEKTNSSMTVSQYIKNLNNNSNAIINLKGTLLKNILDYAKLVTSFLQSNKNYLENNLYNAFSDLPKNVVDNYEVSGYSDFRNIQYADPSKVDFSKFEFKKAYSVLLDSINRKFESINNDIKDIKENINIIEEFIKN